MLKQLRIKFVATIMCLITVLLCVLLTMIYQFTATSLETDILDKMQTVSENLNHRLPIPELTHPDDRLHYFVLSLNIWGDLVIMGGNSFDLSDADILTTVYEQAISANETTGILEDYSLQYMYVGNSRTTVIFADISNELATLHTLRNNCILIGIAAFLALFAISCTLAWWLVRPVEAAWQQQRQFVADASHELKTPITVILTNTELLSSPDYTDEEKTVFTESIMAMTTRMRSLVEGMLDLARVDNGVVKSAFTEVDYSDLVEQSLLPFEPMYFESGRMLESKIEPGLLLKGSAGHLSQVTDILLDNAMKYSYGGSTVRLTLHRQGRHALLCVDSPGDPISPEDLRKIFQRFYTVDKARTGNSYGLGLCIAKGIVEEHGGKIWAESAVGHNKFFIKLPL